MSRRTTYIHLFRWVAIAAMGGVLVWLVARHHQGMREHLRELSVGLAVASLAMVLGAHGLLILLWRVLVRLTVQVDLSIRQSAVACGLATAGRYIPGKIWAVAGKAALSATDARQRSALAAVSLLETLLIQAAGLMVGIGALPAVGATLGVPPAVAWSCAGGVFIAAGLVCYPPFLHRAVNPVLLRLKQTPVTIDAPAHVMGGVLLLYCLPWILYGSAAWLAFSAVNGLALGDWPTVAGSFASAHVAGFLAFFSPGGLGVREGVFASVLAAGYHDADVAVLVSLLMRVITMVAEAVGLLVALILVPGSPGRVTSPAAE